MKLIRIKGFMEFMMASLTYHKMIKMIPSEKLWVLKATLGTIRLLKISKILRYTLDSPYSLQNMAN